MVGAVCVVSLMLMIVGAWGSACKVMVLAMLLALVIVVLVVVILVLVLVALTVVTAAYARTTRQPYIVTEQEGGLRRSRQTGTYTACKLARAGKEQF